MIRRIPGTSYKSSEAVVFIIIALLALIITYLIYRIDLLNLHPLRLVSVQDNKAYGKQRIYIDFDGNNISEAITPKRYSKEDVFEFYDEKGLIIDVLRPGGHFLNNIPSYVAGDADGDSKAELYLFYQRNDSILLSAYELMGDDGQFLKDFVIENEIFYDCDNDLELSNAKFFDTDYDGSLELVFVLRAGYSLYPRKIYIFNPREKKLTATENSAAGIRTINMHAKPNTSGTYLVVGCNAIENFEKSDPVLFNDRSGWLILYDELLSKPFFVKEYPENKSSLQAILKNTDRGLKIFCLINELRSETSYLQRIDLHGNIEESISLPYGNQHHLLLNYYSSYLGDIVLSVSGHVLCFSSDLRPVKQMEDIGFPLSLSYTHFSNYTSESGYFLFGHQGKLYLRNEQLKLIGRTRIPEYNNELGYTISLKEFRSYEDCIIALSGENEGFLLKIESNLFYLLRHLIVILLFAGLFLAFYIIFRVQVYFYNRRFITQNKIAELQLQTIQNQLQPHFTFNVLNAIGSMIYTNRKEEAYEYLGYFSDMLRSVLLLRNEANWQIGEELSFISSYMAMENLRYENKFVYKQSIGNDVDIRKLVPKLSIQSFVENAIRHGLVNKKTDCILEVNLSDLKEHIRVEVKDNGIGRESARSYLRTQGGLGNKILQDYIRYYNQNHKTRFYLEIEDLYSEQGAPDGTQIIFLIPKDIEFTESET